jgi:hypothetical protein
MAEEGKSFEEVRQREEAIERGNMERGTGITRTQFEKRYPSKGMNPEEAKKLESEYKKNEKGNMERGTGITRVQYESRYPEDKK